MRNVLLFVFALLVLALASTDAYALGGRRMMNCNVGAVTQLQLAPTQATQQDLLSVPAPKIVAAKPYVAPTRTKSGLDITGLARLNGDKPLGSAFKNVAAK